jgi:hypothetical protein
MKDLLNLLLYNILHLFQWKFDYLTSTYFLLLEKKLKGRPVRLIQQQHKQSQDTPRVYHFSFYKNFDQ